MGVETLVSHPVTGFEFGVGTQAVQAPACAAAAVFGGHDALTMATRNLLSDINQ
jgi:hypothetical protein